MADILEDIDLRSHSALRAGGVGKYFISVKTRNDLREAVRFSHEIGLPIFVLGEGTNTFFAEGELSYVFVKMGERGVEVVSENNEEVVLEVQAGENWDGVVKSAVESGWAGLEALSAIPGSVGASPFQNIGAYGSEVKDVIVEVCAYDTRQGEIVNLSNKDCNFRYRDSIFKNEERGRFIILSVVFKLSKKLPQMPRYEDVKKYFERRNVSSPSLGEIREAICEIRAAKLPDPSVVPNLGSFFKNPIVEKSKAAYLKSKFPDMKMYELQDDTFKIPAGWLVEKTFGKDAAIGCTRTWKNNALVLTNPDGKCRTEDILVAQREITEKVKSVFDIELEREPILVE